MSRRRADNRGMHGFDDVSVSAQSELLRLAELVRDLPNS
jgi:hypothetical protein